MHSPIRTHPAAVHSPSRPSFQETSAESFEASLMAGGYGVYKTSEWIRQPQFAGQVTAPFPHPAPAVPGPSSKPPPPKLELPPPPMSEKQRRKQARLDKFRNGGVGVSQKLYIGQLRGIGRVILDETPTNGLYTEVTAAAAARRPAEERRKRKAAADFAMRERERKERDMVYEEVPSQPNWPDHDFPWCLQEKRRLMHVEEDKNLRLRALADFFSGDTDDEELEDAVEKSLKDRDTPPQQQQQQLPPSQDPAPLQASLATQSESAPGVLSSQLEDHVPVTLGPAPLAQLPLLPMDPWASFPPVPMMVPRMQVPGPHSLVFTQPILNHPLHAASR